VAETLVAAGADVEAVDDNGDTPLITACVQGYRDIALLLLAHGAELSTTAHSAAVAQQEEELEEGTPGMEAVLELFTAPLPLQEMDASQARVRAARVRLETLGVGVSLLTNQ
jgi:ankyrin repeat protein